MNLPLYGTIWSEVLCSCDNCNALELKENVLAFKLLADFRIYFMATVSGENEEKIRDSKD